MTGPEFLVGGAAGCDLRLPGANLPPIICQFLRFPSGLAIRWLSSQTPVFLNGTPLSASEPVSLQDGDQIRVGPAEITAHFPPNAYIRPKLVPFEAPPAKGALGESPSSLAAALAEREAELARREQEVQAAHERYTTDLARLDRWQAALEARQHDLDRRADEIDQRFGQLRQDTAELEEQVRLAAIDQERLTAEADRLDKLRGELEARAAMVAERAAQVEAQHATLAVLRAQLERQQEEMQQESARLAADQQRQEIARRELDARLKEAEQLRADLGTVRDDHEAKRRALIEQHSLLAATLADIQRQKDALAAEEERLKQKEAELDARSAEIAEQTAVLKSRVAQVQELHDRLTADRQAVREREGTLGEAEAARQALQEQLRKRAEELNVRAKQFDEIARTLAEDRAAVDRLRAELTAECLQTAEQHDAARRMLDEQAAQLQRQGAALAEREAALSRQVEKLKEVGQAVATERKLLAEARAAFEADQRSAEEMRARLAAEIAELRRQAPELDGGAQATLEKLAAARDVLRGHLTELHTYAQQTRAELDAARSRIQAEAESLREREHELERARSEHRLAVAGFRQQLLDWQSQVAALKQAMAQSETRLEQRQAEVDAAARQVDRTTQELARQEAELRHERQIVAEKRSEMERHLADMREWYRKKLRELAAGRPVDESDMPVLEGTSAAPRVIGPADSRSESAMPVDAESNKGAAIVTAAELTNGSATFDDLDPGDRHLGELLQSCGLVDADTLHALWAEAGRQRRTLRQVLLASGAVTLYQLALIEAGNLDALVLGRLRVIDRIRTTPRETIYRVFDPARQGVCLLRHLSESEAQDAVRPDEYRQRFATALTAAHPNLANTLEVLDVNGRPAVLQEWVTGLPSPDWPASAAVPGIWVRLLTEAARGLNHAHRSGLVHGRLGPESFVLTTDGTLKVLGFGEPPWLSGSGPTFDPLPAADLRALGQVAFGWAQLAAKKRGGRAKPFPPVLAAVIRRLESGSEPPMADVVAFDRPYSDAAELIHDLARLAEDYSVPDGEWAKLIGHVAEAMSGSLALRESA